MMNKKKMWEMKCFEGQIGRGGLTIEKVKKSCRKWGWGEEKGHRKPCSTWWRNSKCISLHGLRERFWPLIRKGTEKVTGQLHSSQVPVVLGTADHLAKGAPPALPPQLQLSWHRAVWLQRRVCIHLVCTLWRGKEEGTAVRLAPGLSLILKHINLVSQS